MCDICNFSSTCSYFLFIDQNSLLYNCSQLLCYYFVIGYSIFLVVGNLPDCPADELLKKFPVSKVFKPSIKNVSVKTPQENELEKAIK